MFYYLVIQELNLYHLFVNKINFCNKECSYNYYRYGLITSIKDKDSDYSDDDKDTLL